jgi:tetratricopeptide (TPR) repeat protein
VDTAWRIAVEKRAVSEALQLLSTAMEKADKVRILRARGDLEAKAGDLVGAVADYEALVELSESDGETFFSLSMALLKQGRESDAVDIIKRGVHAHCRTPNDPTVVVRGINSNFITLFSICTRSQMAAFLDPVLELLDRERLMGLFEQALSTTVFSFLSKHETQAEDRFADILWALENIVSKHVDVSVPILLLTVGLEFFKREDRKALMKLSREERALFTKELAIEAN